VLAGKESLVGEFPGCQPRIPKFPKSLSPACSPARIPPGGQAFTASLIQTKSTLLHAQRLTATQSWPVILVAMVVATAVTKSGIRTASRSLQAVLHIKSMSSFRQVHMVGGDIAGGRGSHTGPGGSPPGLRRSEALCEGFPVHRSTCPQQSPRKPVRTAETSLDPRLPPHVATTRLEPPDPAWQKMAECLRHC
jgi:hypothetical protein